MTPLREQFKRHLTVQRLSPKTHEACIGAVKGLAGHYQKSPDQLSDEQVQNYFEHLLEERKYAWSSCNVIFCGIKLFYEEILDRDTSAVIPPRPRQKQLPIVLSQDEAWKLINSCDNLKHRTLLLGVQIYVIKRMMGHAALSTTVGYIHVSNEFISTIKSPLDTLEEMNQTNDLRRIQ